MLNKRIYLIILCIIITVIPACQKNQPANSGTVVIGISSDIESLNPLFSYTVDEGSVSELMYMSLVQYEWNFSEGEMDVHPMLAKSWEWNSDSSAVTFNLRKDAKWSDGRPVTAADVVFSFDLYSDPAVQSRLYGSFKIFDVDTSQHIKLKETFSVKDPYTLTVKFKKGAVPGFTDINIPVIPEHVFKNIPRKNIITAEKELKSVTDGPFMLDKWNKNQSIILKANPACYLTEKGNVSHIIFKIVPDYTSRLTQLKEGEIDLMEDVKADNVADLEKSDNINISAIKGREYDYIGWNNIDPEAYRVHHKIVPNKLFGDPLLRRAFTYAINREEILKDFLNGHGQVAAGPVAPIFKGALNGNIKPLPYSPDKAKELLKQAGWKDNNNDGILEKEGKKLAFNLYIPSGNPRRQFAAEVIKNNLKIVGADVTVVPEEPGVFFDNMFAKKFNAWMAGWSVPIPLDLKSYWYSDLSETPLNVTSYMNKKADALLDKALSERSVKVRDKYYKEFQKIIYKDCPATFLYWIDNIVAYNKRIQNLKVTPLGAVYHCWKWATK